LASLAKLFAVSLAKLIL